MELPMAGKESDKKEKPLVGKFLKASGILVLAGILTLISDKSVGAAFTIKLPVSDVSLTLAGQIGPKEKDALPSWAQFNPNCSFFELYPTLIVLPLRASGGIKLCEERGNPVLAAGLGVSR